MGCCTGRCLLITICVLQLASTIERQVFDFLGYMWSPIIGNFLQLIFVIIGLFGAYQYRPKVVIVYCVWCLLWLAWNVFVICFYLEVGMLERSQPILNINTGHRSWWLQHGIGCQLTNQSDELRSVEEKDIAGCLLQYYYVEIIHAGVQCLLALLGFCVACFVIYVFTEEDDSSQPVHDELEYIKMRYRSPARSSFRDNKTYETLTAQTSTYSSMDRGVDHPLYEEQDGSRTSSSTSKNNQKTRRAAPKELSPGFEPDLPWTQPAPKPGSPRRRQQSPDDYGFNTSLQPLYGGTPGQTVI